MSPLARRLAALHGVDPTTVEDNGPMSLTLTGDHRVLNGVDGAELLVAIAGRLASPQRIALG